MKFKHLIDAGKAHLEEYPGYAPISVPGRMFPLSANLRMMFPLGARWMHDRLNELQGSIRSFDPAINYNFYGYLKYGICISGAFLAAWWLSGYGWLFIPLAILLFYLLEIHFLFLFPLLIDHSSRPVLTGIRAIFKIGIVQCLFTVIPISIFMMTGLLWKKDRFRNWYIGCLAILIWYNNEVRNRISSSL